MSPATAFGFMVLGASLLWLGKSNFSPRIPQVLGLIGFFNGFISLVGYVYGIRALYLIPAYQTMAVNTTCLFVALGLGVTCARPQAGLMIPLTSNRMGGTLIRTLLPVLLVSTVVTGWVRLWGEKQGFYRTEFGTTLRTVFEGAAFIVVLWVAAYLLNQADAKRQEREGLIRGILESVTDGVAIFDKDWHYRFVNEEFVHRIGMTQDQLIGKNAWEVFPEFVGTDPYRQLQRAMKERVVVEHEFYLPRVPGWFSSRVFPTSDGGLVTFSRNITEQREAEERLRESEEKFRTLADFIPQMVWMCTPDGLNIYFNQRWVEYTGMSLDESYGRGWNTPFHDDDKQKAWDAWNKAVAMGGAYQVESRLRAADGTYRWFLMQGTPLRDSGGEVVKWFGTCTDIEDMKQSEAALRESEQRFSNAFHTSPAAITITRIADGKFVDVNPAFLDLFGFSREEVVGHTSVELNMLTAASRRDLIRAQLESGGLRHEELLTHTKSGRPIQLLFSSQPMSLAGRPHHVTTLIDITDRKQAEQALRESEDRFRTLADFVPQMVWMCTPDGLNVYFNQRWVDYTGMSLEESYGRGWNTPFHDDDKQTAWDAWNKAVVTGGTYQVESRLRAADGNYRWFLMQGTPLRDATGEIVKWFGTCTDIEDIKKAE
ncbi:MAG TPA: PAS domain-containing protein, partial [Terriglobales bacterium]